MKTGKIQFALVCCVVLAVTACGKHEIPADGGTASTEAAAVSETAEGADTPAETEVPADSAEDTYEQPDAVTSATEFAEKEGLALIDAADPGEYVTIPNLTELSVEGKAFDEDIDALVEKEYRMYEENSSSMQEVEDRGVEDGDMVNIDYTQLVDGTEYQKRQGCFVTIGTGALVTREFEEMLIGLKKGEEKEYAYTYPKDFYDSDLAGKRTTVTVVLNGIYVSGPAELTDEKVQGLGLKMDDGSAVTTTEELRAYIYERKRGAALYYNRKKAVEALLDGSQVIKGFSRDMILAGASCLIGRTVTEDDMTEELEERAFEFVRETLCINAVLKRCGYDGSMAQRARWNAAADYILSFASVNIIEE